MKKSIACCIFILYSLSLSATEWSVKTLPDPKKNGPTTHYVSDPDNLIDEATEKSINDICAEIEINTTVQFGIVLVNSIGSEQVKTFASDLFNYWGIGVKGKDNGLLLVAVIDQKRWEFETGYGLESNLGDYELKQIGENFIVPDFKNKNYGGGLLSCAAVIRGRLVGSSSQIDSFVAQQKKAFSNSNINGLYNNPAETTTQNQTEIGYMEKQFEHPFISILLLVLYSIAFIIFYKAIYTWKKEKKKNTDVSVNPPNKIIFFFIGSIFILFFLLQLIDIKPLNIASIGMQMILLYTVISAYMIEGRIRYNNSILSNTDEPYQTYTQFRTYHTAWNFLGWLIPFFQLPYIFYFYKKCTALRNLPRKCKKCKTEQYYKTNVIDEVHDDQYLNKGQIKEEYLKSRDWDVWHCNACGQTEILGYKSFFTSYNTCPACKFITEKYLGSETVTSPTYTSSGQGKKKYSCEQCNNYREEFYTIAKLTKSSSSGGGSSGGGSWGGSSWGGGRSGGGGAGGGW